MGKWERLKVSDQDMKDNATKICREQGFQRGSGGGGEQRGIRG